MRSMTTRAIIVSATALLAVSPWVLFAQPAANPADALLDVLVWGTHIRIDPAAYPPVLRTEVERHLRRSRAYRSKRPEPADAGLQMVHAAQVRYERRLVAVSNDPSAPAFAAAYVTRLRPCYEWEGYHDCPEREARFADAYQASHPDGPFSSYLPLLAAHRWLCTAEAYDYEKRAEDAARSREAYEQRLIAARRSTRVLIRTAAERLATRRRCFGSD